MEVYAKDYFDSFVDIALVEMVEWIALAVTLVLVVFVVLMELQSLVRLESFVLLGLFVVVLVLIYIEVGELSMVEELVTLNEEEELYMVDLKLAEKNLGLNLKSLFGE